MKQFLWIAAFLASFPELAEACKRGTNSETSKQDLSNLLDAVVKVGEFEGFWIHKITNKVGPRDTFVELRRNVGVNSECKRLVFKAGQPQCSVQYEFLGEEKCE